MTLLLGQAAQGKSTLGAAYVETLGKPLAWANLNSNESDPANLFYLIVASLQEALNDVDLEPLLSYPSINTGPRLEISLHREWIDALFERVPGPVEIVLDGLDRLHPDAPSFPFLQVLIEELPPDIHLLILSREMPPLQIQALKVKQQVFVITNEDLAFTLEETGSFLRDCRGISLRSEQIRSMHQLTEGWVGGLVLLSEILLRMPEDSRDNYLASDVPPRFKGEVFRYFAEEIFSSEPEEKRNLLIECSILKTLEPDFLKYFNGVKNAQGVLRDFSARNLFVTSVYDSEKGEVFRFHQLFREFLREKFETDRDDHSRRALFLRAGTLYEKRGDLEQAAEFYLQCRAYDRAACSLERIGMYLWRSGRTVDLARRLRALPKELVLQRPWLLFYLSLARRCTDVEENIGTLKDALDLFEKACDVRGQMVSLALLIETTIARGSDFIPMAELIERAESLLGDMDKKTFCQEKAYLWCELGIAYSLRGGDPRKGFLACTKAETEAKRVGDKVLLLNAIVGALIGLIYLGEFSHAWTLSKKGTRVVKETGIRELEMLLAKELCELALFRGDFREAKERVGFLKEGLDRYGFQYLYATTHYSEMRLNIYAGNYVDAAEIGRRLLNFSRATGNRFGEAMYYLLMGIASYRKGDFRESRGLVYRAIEEFSTKQTHSAFHIHLGKLLVGLLFFHLRDDHRAGEFLIDALEYFTRIKSAIHAAESHLALALWKWRNSEFDESASHLATAFKIAEERGYKRLTIFSDQDLARVCGLTLEFKVAEAENYAGCLLVAHLADMAGPELDRLKQHTSREIRKKAQSIMKTIHRSKVSRIRK